MKKVVALLLAMAMLLSLAACGATAPAAEAAKEDSGKKVQTIGLCMPTKEQTIWSMQAERLQSALEKAGYTVLVEFAEDDSAKQSMQVENMISKGVDMVIIAAVDCAALTDVCEKAKEDGVYVIADDRAITNTEAVDYYVTCDYDRLAEMQGQYIVDTLDLDNTDETFTMEIFSGSQDDTNAIIFYDGQMRVLQPYVDSGKIVIKSGQSEYTQTAIQSWDTSKAQARMDNLLSGYYSDEPLDICLATSDCLTIGCISSLESMGYGGDNGVYPYPLTTGQDAELAAVKNIVAGKQTMTVFIDGTLLAELMVEVVDAINAGKEITPDGTYDNGVIEIPSLYYDPFVIDASNVDHLIDVGFYTKEEVYG